MAFAFCQAKKVVDIRFVLFATGALRQSPHSFGGAAAARRRRSRRRNAPSALRCTAAIMHGCTLSNN